MKWQKSDPNRLEVYSETRKRRIFVGTLRFDPKSQVYSFDYDRAYLLSKSAIPMGPELPLKKPHHQSKKGELFPSFEDRIPSRQNPAYEDYCLSQGISPKEKNKIVLLATIGRRGPSTFVFEPVHDEKTDGEVLKRFRNSLDLSLRDIAAAFDLPLPTLARIEVGRSHDRNTIRLLEIYTSFPEIGLWITKRNQRKLHQTVSRRLLEHFSSEIEKRKNQPDLFIESRS